MARSEGPAFQSNLFDRVGTSAELRDALSEISGVLGKSTYSTVLGAFFERDFVLEVVLSGLNNTIPLNQWILSDFPTQPNILFSSFSWRLLWRLSSTFCFRNFLNPKSQIMDVVTRYDRMVNAVPHILESLLDLTFGGGHTTWREKNGDWTAANQRASEGRRVNPILFNDFSLRTPTNAHEKAEAIQSVFNVLKSVLQFYLELLSSPNVSHALRDAFLAQTPPPPPPDANPRQEGTTGPTPPAVAPEYPQGEQLATSLPFHEIEGFGKWKILLSSRAEADFRESSRKNRGSFRIIIKKIKELSHGNFSPNNQKRLKSTRTNVPILAARVTPDIRLIYHIDSIPKDDSQDEEQAIRIFGIYTHAQMDDRLWDSIGRQLGRKGKEYIRRCTFRTPAGHEGHFFSPTLYVGFVHDAESTDSYLDLPPDDMDKVHSLLVLEKYMSFSRELLYTMLANLDSVTFPFNMSPQEQEIVDFPYSCFVIGRSGTGKTTTMLYKMLRIEGMYQLNSDYIRKPRQIFVTKSPVLALRVQDHSQKLVDSLMIASLSPQQLKDKAALIQTNPIDQVLVNLNDEQRRRSDLPRKFSQLQDSNFPLFITFDHLCDMIEADYEPPEASGTSARSLRNNVSFQAFQRIYWSHLPRNLVKGLDPAMVFSEMLGIIKGSEEALSMPDGYLDQTTYENISKRRHPTFAYQRGRVYDIFEMYQAKKRKRGEWDVADRTHAILRKMTDSERGVVWQKVDQLCVDEAQDNLLIDALVLRSLCHNPDGLFWAGDTAQTISVGSSFRFNDLKSFLYRIEEQRVTSPVLASHCGHPPKTFQLTTNYRSHAGILNCAHSVIELITMFWPDSIDTLAAEKGIVEGAKPIFLWGHETYYTQFLFGTSKDFIEFGANQCVLVRNEDARQKLVDRIGNAALIMTVYESKGLEFNDVLLYNFFEDSSAEYSQWRIVLSAIMSEKATSIRTRDAPRFDPIHHSSICNELKCLYVAITRARMNLWILDNSDKAEPMKIYWSSSKQIRDYTPGMELPRFGVSSSPEEWAARGKELFDGQHYLQAKQCYERAALSHKAAISNAYLLREEARMTPLEAVRTLKNARYNAFGNAADSFLCCARDAASENQNMYRRLAAECFEEGGDLLRASETYLDAQDYNSGGKILCKLGRFDHAVQVMKCNEKSMAGEVKQAIKRAALLHYLSGKKLLKAQQLFSPEDDVVEYLEAPELEEHGLDVQVAAILKHFGEFLKAGELHLRKRRPMEAIPLFLEAPERDESTRQVANVIIQELWSHISFNVSSSRAPGSTVTTLISWSANLNLAVLQPNERDEIEMFQAAIAWDEGKIVELARIFLSRDNAAAAALCLNHYVSKVGNFKPKSIDDLANYLELFLGYTRTLSNLASPTSRSTFASAMRLFGVQRLSTGTSDETFTIRRGTFLHSFCDRQKPGTLTKALSGVVLRQTLREAVHEYLWDSVTREYTRYGKVPQMTSCLCLALPGRPKTSRHAREPITSSWYNVRIRINLQQILIIQTLRPIRNWSTLGAIRRHSLDKFYEAMNPPFYRLGSRFYLDTDLIPEYQDGIQVVKSWAQECVDILDPHQRFEFLTHLIRGCFLVSAFDKEGNSSYWSRALPLFMPVSRVFRRGEHVKVDKLVSSLRGQGTDSITYGILSLSHIIVARLPIDIGVFCDVLEFLFGSIIIATGWKDKHWHKIKLSWSWLARFMPKSMDKMAELAEKSIDIPLLLRLITDLRQVLECILNDTSVRTEFLLLESKDLSRAKSFRIRGLFITRICRALTLLGLNMWDDKLRIATWTTVKSLSRFQRKFDSLSQPYVNAQTPKDLVDELQKNSGGNLPDELLQFHNSRQETTPEPSQGVNFLSYENEEDIIPLFTILSKSAACGANANSVKGNAELESEQFATSGRPAQNRFFSRSLGRSHDSGLKLKKRISAGRPPHVSIGLKIIQAAFIRQEGLSTNHDHEKMDDLDLRLSKSDNARKALNRLYHKTFDPRSNIHYERNVARLSGSFQEVTKLLQVLPQACLANNTCRELEKALRGVICIQRKTKRVATMAVSAEPATDPEDKSTTRIELKEGSDKVDDSKSSEEL